MKLACSSNCGQLFGDPVITAALKLLVSFCALIARIRATRLQYNCTAGSRPVRTTGCGFCFDFFSLFLLSIAGLVVLC